MFYPTIQQGFTLIELLIVMAIIAILVGFGYPSYEQYLQESRRTDGQMALFDLANRFENYYAEHNTYEGATLGTGNTETDLLVDTNSTSGWYQLDIISQNDTSFLLQATPQKAQINDVLCQSLTLSNLGIKAISEGPNGTLPTGLSQDCWQ
jgi:type IV pilus assembly protein PilE